MKDSNVEENPIVKAVNSIRDAYRAELPGADRSKHVVIGLDDYIKKRKAVMDDIVDYIIGNPAYIGLLMTIVSGTFYGLWCVAGYFIHESQDYDSYQQTYTYFFAGDASGFGIGVLLFIAAFVVMWLVWRAYSFGVYGKRQNTTTIRELPWYSMVWIAVSAALYLLYPYLLGQELDIVSFGGEWPVLS